MNRKRKEAHARRALAAGRRSRPTPSERVITELQQPPVDVHAGSSDALKERPDVLAAWPRET